MPIHQCALTDARGGRRKERKVPQFEASGIHYGETGNEPIAAEGEDEGVASVVEGAGTSRTTPWPKELKSRALSWDPPARHSAASLVTCFRLFEFGA